ncbi:hypothetical protein ACFPK9_05580 [Rubritalea spongiae]|uniref:Trimeric autotransporter adhesin YadA-like head domain-containing protein n=1 Tax=Rubritalea spongiae TaxID=430797 RepID=A0ABW5E5N6_9BACT
MKKKVLVLTATGLSLVFLVAATSTDQITNPESESLISNWLVVGSPNTHFTPGDQSLTVGDDSQATGEGAVAFAGATASGDKSMAVGWYAQADDFNAIAIGNAARAGYYAVAIGDVTYATGISSFAAGSGRASGMTSAAIGYQAHSSGGYSTAIGYQAHSSGGYSTAIGIWSQSTGEASLAFGGGHASGDSSIAFKGSATGLSSISLARNSVAYGADITVMGKFNDVGSAGFNDDPYLPHPDGHLVVVGNGTDNYTRSNAIVTKHSGETSLINKHWESANPLADATDDPYGDGKALVVEGHALLKGKVVLAEAQGDISMGEFGQ